MAAERKKTYTCRLKKNTHQYAYIEINICTVYWLRHFEQMKSFLATVSLLVLVAIVGVAAQDDGPHMLSDEFIELVSHKAETWKVS